MSRLLAASVLLSTALFMSVSNAADPPARPHLVLFLADDLGWADCQVNGGAEARTPNMLRVARDGMTLTRAFVASPSCAPSRAALLTALDPIRNGSMFNHQPPRPEVKRWPAYFQELGYEVAAIGKVAHYAQVKEYGFDHVSHFNYHQDDCIEEAVTWLRERRSEKPLCLLVGTNWPHVPWPNETEYDAGAIVPPPTLVDTFETRQARARYDQAVSNADRDLGLVYDAARDVLGKDLLFVFTADHGSQFPFGKWNCSDAGLRTPMIAVWPGKIAAGARSEALVSWIDLLPTMHEAVHGTGGDSKGPAERLDGRSFLPVLVGERSEHRERVFATHSGDGAMNEYPIRSVRSADWRYVRNLAPESEFHSHVDKAEQGDGRSYWDSWVREAETNKDAAAVVQRYYRRPAEELYDLRSDPWQLKNLADDPAAAETLEGLRADLDGWMQANGDEGLASERAFKPQKKPAARQQNRGRQAPSRDSAISN